MYQPYVYKIINKVTKQFYYGSRFANVRHCRHAEDDLWKFYFTSSKRIKKMIEEFGVDSFETQIVFKHDQYEECFWEEQRLILESKDDIFRLNRTYMNPVTGRVILTTYNETEEEK